MKYTVSFYSWAGTWTIDIEACSEEEAINKALLNHNPQRSTKFDLKYIVKHGEAKKVLP